MKYHKLTENAVKPEGFWGKLMIRSMNKGHHELTDWALAHFPIENGSRVLDVGCGGGRTVSKLCDLVGSGKVYGIDYSELCVKKAQKLNHKNVLCGRASISQAADGMKTLKLSAVPGTETAMPWGWMPNMRQSTVWTIPTALPCSKAS